MTSMIDVVFLLLVFFVWTSSFDAPETQLPGRIAMSASATEDLATEELATEEPSTLKPSSSAAAQPKRKPSEVVVRIVRQAGGGHGETAQAGRVGEVSYRVGAVSHATIEAVREKLTAIHRLPLESIVIIDPEDQVSVAQTISVFDLARQIGFAQVVLAVDRPTPAS